MFPFMRRKRKQNEICKQKWILYESHMKCEKNIESDVKSFEGDIVVLGLSFFQV